ncbi:MAG: methyltransferase domain-containing protein [Pirellulaceae bacterium]|nr:methyltransferase domain-containing protein [Pirellulaceae bacterium]
MRWEHFQQLRPQCPVCRGKHAAANPIGADHPSQDYPLELAQQIRVEAGHTLEGILQCVQPECLSQFPIIDGIPIIVQRLRSYIAENVFPIMHRLDLSESIESLIGDCCSQNSAFDSLRQHVSSYAWDHYAEFDPQEVLPESSRADSFSQPLPGSIVRLLQHALACGGPLSSSPVAESAFSELLDVSSNPSHSGGGIGPSQSTQGPLLDIGCSIGRTSFELARSGANLVLGIDLNFCMLRYAARILRQGRLEYPRRRVGVVYDRRAFDIDLPHREQVDFWVCDATALPFAAETFQNSVAFNVLDAVSSPWDLIVSLRRVLKKGGQVILGCPYDWSALVTPVENWLGGHSQRSPQRGESQPALKRLLALAGDTNWPQLELVDEQDSVPWTIRIHDRSSMHYRVHLVRARK